MRFTRTDILRQIAQQRALTRRDFLRSAAIAGAGSRVLGFAPLRAAALPRQQKIVVVTFGGGARDEETFAPEGQENIPHLMKELIPQSTFLTQIEGDPEYKGRTTMLILPDFGRDSDFSSSGNGFQHHRTGDPLSRTTWMMALGPRIRQNRTVDRAVDSLDLVPTLGALMNFATPLAKGRPVVEVL